MKKCWQQRTYRLVVMQHPDGRRTEHAMEYACRQIVVPILTRTGFGQRVYEWNGRDLNVQGLPVYRA